MAKRNSVDVRGVTFEAVLDSGTCIKIDANGGGEVKFSFSEDAIDAINTMSKSYRMKNLQIAVVIKPD